MLIGTELQIMLLFWHAKKQVISAEALPPTKVAPSSESDPPVMSENRERSAHCGCDAIREHKSALEPRKASRLMHLTILSSWNRLLTQILLFRRMHESWTRKNKNAGEIKKVRVCLSHFSKEHRKAGLGACNVS